MENIYNRLVRDNIPDICISNNQKSKFRELDDLKYVSALNEELKHDIQEQKEEKESAACAADVTEKLEHLNAEDLAKIKEKLAELELKEETKEYLADNSIDELAYIIGVIEALAITKGSNLDEV